MMAKKQPKKRERKVTTDSAIDDAGMIPSANYVRHTLVRFLEAMEGHDLSATEPYAIPLHRCGEFLILAKLSFEKTNSWQYDLKRLF
jgi:hypothetical protein